MSTINNSVTSPSQLTATPSQLTDARTDLGFSERLNGPGRSAVQEANSSEEKAIANSTNLSRELSKRKNKTGSDEESELKRIKLLEKITKVSSLNLSAAQIEEKVAEVRAQLKSGHVLIKDLLDSQGGETALAFAALKKIKSEEADGSKVGDAAGKYIELLEIHKNKTLTSWANTSNTIAENVTDKELAFQIQSMLATASENNFGPRELLKTIIDIGGEDRGDHVKDSSIRALAADIRSHASSADLGTLTKNLSMLNKVQSVASMYKLADDHLAKMFLSDMPTIKSSDYLEMTLDLSINLEPSTLTAYSIAVLGASQESEYKFGDSVLRAFKEFPIAVWSSSDERQTAVDYVSKALHNLSDATRHTEISIKNALYKSD